MITADLDLSLVDINKPQALAFVERILTDAKQNAGFDVLALDERTPPRIRFVGPLGRERWIKLARGVFGDGDRRREAPLRSPAARMP